MRTVTLFPPAMVMMTAIAAAAFASPAHTPQPGTERSIGYAEGFSTARQRTGPRGSLVRKDFQPASEDGARSTGTGTGTGTEKNAGSRVFSDPSGEFWIYSAATEIFFDDDGDGYYHYLRVRFDADTLFARAYVYAELYLSRDGEIWEPYFATEDFVIEGSTSFDEYEVDTELLAGYPTGLYDVLVEIYDAASGEFLAELGPLQSSGFSILPLEDAEHDTPPSAPVSVSVEHGGAGSVSWLWLGALLALAAAARRWQHQGDAASARR